MDKKYHFIFEGEMEEDNVGNNWLFFFKSKHL